MATVCKSYPLHICVKKVLAVEPCDQITFCTKDWSHIFSLPNAKHSGGLGVATKEPRKGRPAAIGRVLMRIVNG